MSIVQSVKEFRKTVDKIPDPRDSTLIKAFYLCASRTNELLTRQIPSDLGHTRAVGDLVSCELSSWGRGKNYVKVLVLTLPVLKRRPKRKGVSVVYKTVGVPCSNKFEPWAVDILKHIQNSGSLHFDLTRRRVNQIVHKHLDTPKNVNVKNLLRHTRLTHLVSYYGFTAEEVILFAGWSFGSAFRGGQLDSYLHLDWRKTFPKLLKAPP